jgi:N-methylhydantoinase B
VSARRRRIDPVTRELFKHATAALVDEMAVAIVRTARSTNLKNSMDLSAALCDPQGRLIAQGLTLPLHLGSVPGAMQAFLARFGHELRPGDVYALNDPYNGGTHLPDIYVAQPVFAARRLVGHVVTIAHHTDIGGKTAGGNGCDATEVYQEGLCLPPVRLMQAGKPVEAIWRLIERNVRVPEQVLGDLRAQLAAGHVGARGLLELVERYGAATLGRLSEAALDYAESEARHAIRALPDGLYTFTDYLDDDGIDPGPIPIRVTLRVHGDELTVDFSGSGAQVRGAINCVLPFTKSAVYACVRCLLPPEIPNNEGYFRPINVIAPAGTIVNPRHPAAVAARGLTGFRIANAVLGALAQVAPDRVPAAEAGGDTGVSLAGYWPDGSPFVLLEFVFASWGARPFADGIDGAASVVVNFSNNPVEMIEAELPIAIDKYEFVPDSGGDGQYRGGLALERHYRLLADSATLQLRSDRRTRGPYGLNGGKEGGRSRNVLVRGGRRVELPGKTTTTMRRGDRFEHRTAGAGGWGPPRKRRRAARAQDLREGKVTPKS